ncbi:HEPN domain-containing protein [Pseudoxanthomonas mexicana]|uniref:HEPN domain-containing protein n=1 Tax=Pseudoxanthomonas mexicana TaxID=128785 RepID=UPI00398B6C83
MPSRASLTFDHAIQDAVDLVNHFDKLNTQPPPPENEVLKRASLVMALAALETYFQDLLVEAVDALCGGDSAQTRFMRDSLANDLKYFHTPSADRVRPLFQKYLGLDITDSWKWNMMEPSGARNELNKLAKKRGAIAHRSGRPANGVPAEHAVSRDDLRRHIHFIRRLVVATDAVLAEPG